MRKAISEEMEDPLEFIIQLEPKLEENIQVFQEELGQRFLHNEIKSKAEQYLRKKKANEESPRRIPRSAATNRVTSSTIAAATGIGFPGVPPTDEITISNIPMSISQNFKPRTSASITLIKTVNGEYDLLSSG